MFKGILRLLQDAYIEWVRGAFSVRLQSPSSLSTSYTLELPSEIADGHFVGKGAANALVVQELSISYLFNPVKAAATGNFDLIFPVNTVDGVTLTSGDRFLLNFQTNAVQNGIYVWDGTAPVRATDMDIGSVPPRMALVLIQQGAILGDNLAFVSTVPSGGIDTDPIQFSFYPNVLGIGRYYSAMLTGGTSHTVEHRLGNRWGRVMVADDDTSAGYRQPDSVTFVDENNVLVDLTSFSGNVRFTLFAGAAIPSSLSYLSQITPQILENYAANDFVPQLFIYTIDYRFFGGVTLTPFFVTTTGIFNPSAPFSTINDFPLPNTVLVGGHAANVQPNGQYPNNGITLNVKYDFVQERALNCGDGAYAEIANYEITDISNTTIGVADVESASWEFFIFIEDFGDYVIELTVSQDNINYSYYYLELDGTESTFQFGYSKLTSSPNITSSIIATLTSSNTVIDNNFHSIVQSDTLDKTFVYLSVDNIDLGLDITIPVALVSCRASRVSCPANPSIQADFMDLTFVVGSSSVFFKPLGATLPYIGRGVYPPALQLPDDSLSDMVDEDVSFLGSYFTTGSYSVDLDSSFTCNQISANEASLQITVDQDDISSSSTFQPAYGGIYTINIRIAIAQYGNHIVEIQTGTGSYYYLNGINPSFNTDYVVSPSSTSSVFVDINSGNVSTLIVDGEEINYLPLSIDFLPESYTPRNNINDDPLVPLDISNPSLITIRVERLP